MTDKDKQLSILLDQLRTATNNALEFVGIMSEQQFYADLKTQHAVAMCLHNIGEVATKIINKYPDFVAHNAKIEWNSMRGMRNRIAHGYSEVNQKVVWLTCKEALPHLVEQLDSM